MMDTVNPESQNPLIANSNITVKHVLLAYKFGEDACTHDITGNMGICGTVIKETGGACNGPAIVVINELEDTTFVLSSAETTWEFFSQFTPSTGTYMGWIEVRDRVGMLFANNLRTYCETLGVALGHLTFAWKTFFIMEENTGSDKNSKIEVITTNPMIFHVTEFSQSLSADIGRAYMMTIVSSYNTLGILPQFSKLFNATLTHTDGNASGEVDAGTYNNPSLSSRVEEDRYKEDLRRQRIDRSKPMKTLTEAFDSLSTEMTEQAIPHKVNVQKWQAAIRDDFSQKTTEPKQFLPELPMKYSVRIDDKFSTYKINNRNMPFEQPEQDQRLEGIRAIPFSMGTTLPVAIDRLMLLSQQVGVDMQSVPSQGYRATNCVLRGCDGNYNVKSVIVPYTIPYNTRHGIDTGPGDGLIAGPIEYYWEDGGTNKPRDVISISYRSVVAATQKPLEEPMDASMNSGGNVVYGNREVASMQRTGSESGFEGNGYSGNNGQVGTFDAGGLEDASSASVILSNLATVIKQQTSYNINIRGNPWILNDINRNPLDVMNHRGMSDGGRREGKDWQYILYDKVESTPMYIKLSVWMRPESERHNDAGGEYFYSGFLHVNKIVTRFGIGGRGFTQMLQGLRTEESI